MKTKFVRFAFLAILLVFAILFAGCQPISENADGGSSAGSSSGGNQPLGDGTPPGETPSNGDGYPPYSPSYSCNGAEHLNSINVWEAVDNDDNYHIWTYCSSCNGSTRENHSWSGNICYKCRYDKTTHKGPTEGAASLDAKRPVTVPSENTPLVYLIVSPRRFETTLKDFVDFKTQQGFDVKEMYINESYYNNAGMINAAIEIRKNIKSTYNNNKPTYILLVGDNTEMPTFRGTAYNSPAGSRGDGGYDFYVADYFYSDFDGDYTYDSSTGIAGFSGNYVPEAYIGRFSARTNEDLENQIKKTIKMLQGLSDNEVALLRNHIITQDPRSAREDKGGVDFVKKYFTSTTSNISHYNSGSSDYSSVVQKINNGLGTVTYYGHASPTYWEGNSFTSTAVSSLTNTVYPVVFSMACYTGTFDYKNYNDYSSGTDNPCLAESFMRSPHGAVAFIGSSRESSTPFIIYYMAKSNGLYGILPSLFHAKADETDTAQFARTLGEAHYMGCKAIQGDSSYTRKIEYLEMQIIFGDPSYTPYYTTPTKASLPTAEQITAKAGNNYRFTTAPNAIVAVSKKDASGTGKRSVVSVAVADANGDVSINIPSDAATVSYTLNSSAPQYIDGFVEF